MTRPAIVLSTLALLLALVAPATATELATLWTLPCGTNAEEGWNRRENLAHASDLIHVGFEVTPDGVFHPEAGGVVLQECWTNGEFLAAADEHNYRLIVTGFGHFNGGHTGTGYHQRPPIFDPEIHFSWWQSFYAYRDQHHPTLPIFASIAFNEGGAYCPVDCPEDLRAAYLAIYDRLRPILRGRKIDGFLTPLDPPASALTSRGLCSYVHGNGKSDGEFRAAVRAAKQKYGCVAVTEDRHPERDHNHAPDRYRIARDEGALVYATFGGRNSGNPPAEICRWGAFGHSKQPRNHVGIEGCGYAWQDGAGNQFAQAFRAIRRAMGAPAPPGSYPNWQKFVDAARIAGSLDESWVWLPNHVDPTEPPEPPSVPWIDQAWDRQCVLFSEVFGIPVPECKGNAAARVAFETMVDRIGKVNDE